MDVYEFIDINHVENLIEVRLTTVRLFVCFADFLRSDFLRSFTVSCMYLRLSKKVELYSICGHVSHFDETKLFAATASGSIFFYRKNKTFYNKKKYPQIYVIT